MQSNSNWCSCAQHGLQEDHLYEGKERFVTSAYRKKLEEDAKWKAEEAARCAIELFAWFGRVGSVIIAALRLLADIPMA